jgi:hypothetical protein
MSLLPLETPSLIINPKISFAVLKSERVKEWILEEREI